MHAFQLSLLLPHNQQSMSICASSTSFDRSEALDLALLQADEGRKPAEDIADPESSWLLLDLLICIAGFVVALAGKA